MARIPINLGTGNNTGDGEGLRDGGVSIEANFTELYNAVGWGVYNDAETTPATQVFNTTYSKLQIDGGGANSNSLYLPRQIRGSAELWDTVNSKISPIEVGDSYDVRLDLTISAKTGSPTILDMVLDIGGGASPTINIVSRTIGLSKTPPYKVSVGFPIFSLSTFLANGGQLFFATDTGTITISSRAIFIKRDSKGGL